MSLRLVFIIAVALTVAFITPAVAQGGPAIDEVALDGQAAGVQLRCAATLHHWTAGEARWARVAAACPRLRDVVDTIDRVPTPATSGCPECFVVLRLDKEEGDLHVGLTDKWDPETTTMAHPHLLVEWPDGTDELIALPDGDHWTPSASFVIDGLLFVHPLDKTTLSELVADGRITLIMMVKWPGEFEIDLSKVSMVP